MRKGYRRSVHFVGKPLIKWVCNETEHSQNAEKLAKFLDNFREENLNKKNKELALKIWDARCHGGEKYTCWYVGFERTSVDELYIILHFEISFRDIKVYFRYMEFMQGSKLKGWRIGWNEKCKYVLFSINEKILLEETKRYLRKVHDALERKEIDHLVKFKPSYPDDYK